MAERPGPVEGAAERTPAGPDRDFIEYGRGTGAAPDGGHAVGHDPADFAKLVDPVLAECGYPKWA